MQQTKDLGKSPIGSGASVPTTAGARAFSRLEMMADDYERRGREAREACESLRQWPNRLRACQETARKYEREAASLRFAIVRNESVQRAVAHQ